MSVASIGESHAERFLGKICLAEDGIGYLTPVELQGEAVPDDPRIWFCKNSFNVVQVRVKNFIPGQVHEYDVSLDSVNLKDGGVHNLRCKRCTHDLQVKRIPKLGLLGLIQPPPWGTAHEVDVMLRKLQAAAGLFYLVREFVRDPTREEAPLVASAPGATRDVAKLSADSEVLNMFLDRCNIFARAVDSQSPKLRLHECAKPRTRGILLKAVLEIKMLILVVVEHLQGEEGVFNSRQLQEWTNFQIEIHEDCLKGGVEAQYKTNEPSWESLKALVCGPGEHPEAKKDVEAHLTAAGAQKVLNECLSNINKTVWPRLQQKSQLADLKLPSLDFSSAAGGAEFKLRHSCIWMRAVETYLFDLVHSSQYPKGFPHGIADIRKQVSRPDLALKVLCPSIALDKAVKNSQAELDTLLAEKAERRRSGVGTDGINFNPRNSTGMVNPGENLCASNALLQLLFSVQPFAAAVLDAPELMTKVGDEPSSPSSRPLQGDAGQLVGGLRRLFSEMSHPDRASSCARDVAAALYGKELGSQQDCDELWHRLSSLVEDGLSGLAGKPYGALQKAFELLFTGATYEMRLKTQIGDSTACGFAPVGPDREDAAKKPFLTIPVQPGNKTLKQALEEFTSWSSTGGDEVPWTQERFRRIPPFLCFASRQVSALEWEESLNLTRFVVPASASMQKSCYEQSKALQLQSELRDALEHLVPARRSAAKANAVSCRSLEAEVAKLADVCQHLDAQLEPLAAQIAELERSIGDGFEELDLEDFLVGAVDAAKVKSVIRERLGVDTVKLLADKLYDGGKPSETVAQLVQGTGACLSQAQADAMLAKLKSRWEDHHAHMFDIHGIVLYQGLGQWGHYVAFIRQADGPFLCFDDEQVRELPDAAAVRAEIAERGGEGLPASVRMVVFRRRITPADSELAPIELDGPQVSAVANGTPVNGTKREHTDCGGEGAAGDAKRPRT